MENTKLDRVLEIFFRGLRGEDLSVQKMADEYEVSTKSITRSINDLKNFLADHRELVGHAFAIADSVLVQTVGSIIDLVQSTAEIIVDFADVTTVMQDSGTMHIGLARMSGAERAKAVFESIRQSKLVDTTIGGAQRVLLSITASSRVGLDEVEILSEAVRAEAHPDAVIIIGMRLDEMMGDDMQALIVATAIDDSVK